MHHDTHTQTCTLPKPGHPFDTSNGLYVVVVCAQLYEEQKVVREPLPGYRWQLIVADIQHE